MHTVGKSILPYLSFTALASTFGLFLCGLSICQRIRLLGNSDTTAGAPFLVAFISCAFWLQYGLVKEDNVVIVCNAVGLTLQTAYLIYFYCMLRNRTRLNYIRKIVCLELVLISLMIYCSNYEGFRKTQIIEVLGAACIVLNIATISAPLTSVGEMPNYIATAISALQLSLFFIYPRATNIRKFSPLPSHNGETSETE